MEHEAKSSKLPPAASFNHFPCCTNFCEPPQECPKATEASWDAKHDRQEVCPPKMDTIQYHDWKSVGMFPEDHTENTRLN